jgi:hypothetical protein
VVGNRAAAGLDETRACAVEVLHALVAADRIDLPQFEAAIAQLLAARSEAELAAVAQALPPPVAMTLPERRLARPLRIRSGTGRLRLQAGGNWLARRTFGLNSGALRRTSQTPSLTIGSWI